MAESRTPVDIEVTAGLPYARRFRIVNGTSVWPTLDSFEVRSQIRSQKNTSGALLGTLTERLRPSIDGMDIVLDLELTGQATSALPKGYYDIVVSDPGPVDARAMRVADGKIKVSSMVTAVSDE